MPPRAVYDKADIPNLKILRGQEVLEISLTYITRERAKNNLNLQRE